MNYHLHSFDNGLKAILLPRPSRAVTLYTTVKLGGDYDPVGLGGLSHFLEHMVIKGSTQWPEKLAMALELEKLGAKYDALTSRDHTSYYIQLPLDNWLKGLEILADMYIHPALPANELENEKKVVLEEIKKNDDNHIRQAYDVLRQMMFGDTSLGYSNVGTAESVQAITRDDVINLHQYYSVENTALAIAGDLSVQDMDKAGQFFASLPRSNKLNPVEVATKSDGPKQKIIHRETKQVTMILGMPSFAESHSNMPAVAVIESILSGGFSSRLFKNIREERGLAYSIMASNYSLANYGLFYIHAGVDEKNVATAVEAIISELKKLKAEAVPEVELAKAKSSLIGRTTVKFDGTGYACLEYSWQLLYGQPFTSLDDWVKKIQAVTAEDVMTVANELFTSNNLNLAIVGPSKDEGQFLSLLEV